MDSTRPIRALMRGLDALTVLNMRDGATVSEVAQQVRLPRTTVYRILETLCNAGFVFRDVADDRYRLTIQVRALSDGFVDEAWVTQIARPLIDELWREIGWPVSIATLSGTTMLVRESAERGSPVSLERYSAGSRAPLLTTAAGRVYLANIGEAQRDALIELLAGSNKEQDEAARSRAELERILGEIKSSGYATATRTRRPVDEHSVSVPIMQGDRVIACLTVRFAASAMPLDAGLERYLPKLRQCAARIGRDFSEQQVEAREMGAPQATA